MLSCCDSSTVHNSIIDKIQPCRLHGKPILFVCLNHQTCLDKALFCTDCADIHKGHKWQTIQKYFTPQIIKLLQPDRTMMKSKNEEAIEQMLEEVAKFKARLEYKLIQFQNEIQADYGNLQNKLSSNNDDPIGFTEVNNQTMVQIIKLIDKQKKKSFMNQLRQETQKALKLTQQSINFTLDSLKQTISRNDWQNVKKQERQKMFSSFSSRFKSLQIKKQKPSFRFSKADKSAGVDVSDNCLEVYYKNEAIIKPAVACNIPLTSFYNKLAFKVIRLDKMIIFFQKSVIYLGVCIAEIASSYKFLNLSAPSHGAYFIGSNGLSYHSKLPEYDNKNSGIQFGVGDVIEMWVEFKEGTLNFKKQKGIMNTTFSMKLGLNKKFMQKLTPCVMFSGEEGPKVKLLTQQELQKYQKK